MTGSWAIVKVILTLDTAGRNYPMAMLDLDSVKVWLVTISPGKVKAGAWAVTQMICATGPRLAA